MLDRLPGYNLNIPIQQFPVAPAPPVVPTAEILGHLADSVVEGIRQNSPEQKALRAVQLAKAQSELRNLPLTESLSKDVYAHPEKYITELSMGPGGTSVSAKPVSPEFLAASVGLPTNVYGGSLSPKGTANEDAPLPALEIPPATEPEPTTAPEKSPGQELQPLTAAQIAASSVGGKELSGLPMIAGLGQGVSSDEVLPSITATEPAPQTDVKPQVPPGFAAEKFGNEWYAVNREGHRIKIEPVIKKPVLHEDKLTGKLYDVTDINNPKEVKFPGMAPSGASGEAALEGLSEQDKSTIRSMTQYHWPIPPGGIRNPHQLDLLQKATLYDPSFNPSDYPLLQATKKDYESGKSFQNIRSLNTLAGHLGNLEQSAAALNNTSSPGVNAIGNFFSKNVAGKPAVPVFEADVNAVTNELGQLLRGGAVTDQDVKRWHEAISPSNSPEQLKAAIHEFASLAKSRLDALQQGYEGVMRKPSDIQIVSPKAKAVFTKLGVMTPDEAASTPGGTEGFGKPSASATPVATPSTATKPAPNPVQMYRQALDALRLNPNDPKAKAVIDRINEMKRQGLITPQQLGEQPIGQPATTAITG